MKHLVVPIAIIGITSCAMMPPGGGHVTVENATSKQAIAVDVTIATNTYHLLVDKGTPKVLDFPIPPGDTTYRITATIGENARTLE